MSTKNRNHIEAILMDCLKQLVGTDCPDVWNPGDEVIGRCGLESQHGIELACDLASRLEIEIPLKDNPLIEDSDDAGRKRARRYSEVVDYLFGLTK